MISLDGEPKTIENVSYLFEDSGINKINGKYIYSYCSNFSVPWEKKEELGFECGEIVTMEADEPMGPFKHGKGILKNPEAFLELAGTIIIVCSSFTSSGIWHITREFLKERWAY